MFLQKQFQLTRCAPTAGLWPAVGAHLVYKTPCVHSDNYINQLTGVVNHQPLSTKTSGVTPITVVL